MKKMFSILIVSLLLIFCLFGSDAHATKARNASLDKGIMGVQGLGDLSSGETVEIDDNSSMQVKEFTKSTYWGSGDEDDVFSGAAIVYSVTIVGNGSTSAGDQVILIDAATVPTAYTDATPIKVEISLNIATGSDTVPIPGGVAFATGVSIDVTDNDVHYVIVYSSY